MPVLPLPELIEALAPHRQQGARIGLCNGVFELLHVGHLRYLEAAAADCDVLVVAVNSDASARHHKGPGRPIVPDAERAELLVGLRCVDFATVFDTLDVIPLIEALRPDAHYKGTDYRSNTVPERDAVRAVGGEVRIVGDPKDHASTDLLAEAARAHAQRR